MNDLIGYENGDKVDELIISFGKMLIMLYFILTRV